MNAIEVSNLTHEYNGLRALDGVNFTVAEGEIFGFLGPNGAGKTTTIKILTGQMEPTSGQAQVLGLDVVKEHARIQEQIGVVFEYPNIYERLSARENLQFSARLYGVNAKRVAVVLKQVGLADRAKEKTQRFSSGMKQRLLIARALLPNPRLLFLDEPTRGLDPNVARELRTFIAKQADLGVTVFLTTHYMEEADRLCHRVAILDHGKVIALDTPERLKTEFGTGRDTSLEDVFVSLTGHSLQFEGV